MSSTQGQVITCKAAVAWGPKQPLDVCEIQVHPPKAGEVRVKVLSNALCHTDVYTLDGCDPEGLFPSILGHEASAIVESIGEGVTSVSIGDTVIPCYTPECREPQCIYCQSQKTNLCPKIRATQGKGVMPDGTTRFSKDGKPIYHFMGCSTFSEYTVLADISCAKIDSKADVQKVCMLGCGVSTGWGAVMNTCKVQAGTTAVVFGLGAVGLSVIQACKLSGCRSIVGVDLNSSKFIAAKAFGATYCVNPTELEQGQTANSHLLGIEKWGYDYTFDCTGVTAVMRQALELAHRGWGESCVIGVAAAGHELATRPFQLVTGRSWKGTAFGGWKSRSDVPKLVQKVMRGELPIDDYVTHNFSGLELVNKAIEVLHDGTCLRAIININEQPVVKSGLPRLMSSNRFGPNGSIKRFTHWSESNQCDMTFSIYIPQENINQQRGQAPAVLYYLAGLTCSDEQGRTKMPYQKLADKHNLAIVFPDTSPRVDVEGDSESWDFGKGAGFYVDATTEKWAKHYNMYTYVTKELPEFVRRFFPVDQTRQSISGHSMGGHGALVCMLRNPRAYRSVSAFAPIVNPTQCAWGKKAFEGYLGGVEEGKAYDAVELLKNYQGEEFPLLVDQGREDQFLHNNQLQTSNLVEQIQNKNWDSQVRMQAGFDHSYFFIASFIEEHIEFHARALNADRYPAL